MNPNFIMVGFFLCGVLGLYLFVLWWTQAGQMDALRIELEDLKKSLPITGPEPLFVVDSEGETEVIPVASVRTDTNESPRAEIVGGKKLPDEKRKKRPTPYPRSENQGRHRAGG